MNWTHSVLITDDDVNFRETVQGVLEPAGYRTYLAGDGEEALRIVQAQSIDVVLLDMHMPRLTGLETIRLVRRMRVGMPCILLSADADEWLIAQAKAAEAFSVLRKPVSRTGLTDTVQQAIFARLNDSAFGGPGGCPSQS